MQNLFVYGTLEFPEVIRKLLGRVPTAEPATLHGYARYLLLNRHYPGIVRRSGMQVDGVLYHGITPKYLRILDRYEDNIYQRRRVQVLTSLERYVTAWVYVIPPRHSKELTGMPWDRQAFIQNQLKRFLNVRCN